MNKDKSNELNALLNQINQNISDDVLEGELDSKFDEVVANDEQSRPMMVSEEEKETLDEHFGKGDFDPEVKQKPKKHRVNFFGRSSVIMTVGIITVIFFIIGLVFSVVKTVSWSSDLINDTKLKEELATYVFPSVVIDIPEFTEVKNLDNSAVLLSAVWKLIIDEQDKTKYVQDEFSNIHVPQLDIELYIRKFFGPNVKVEHRSVGDATFPIDYIPEEQAYVFQSSPQYLSYMPKISKISKDKDIYTLNVEYLLPSPLWHLDKSNKNTRTDKTMIYKVKKLDKKEGYQLLSVISPNSG
ncbi:MAG: hypothetical protein RR145_04545, partial [Oscillospiraceae bacterium]